MKNILVPISVFQNDTNLLDYACSLAVKSNAHITLIYTGMKKWVKNKSVYGYHSSKDPEAFFDLIKQARIQKKLRNIFAGLNEYNISFSLKYTPNRAISAIVRECDYREYDLILASTHTTPGIRGYVQHTYLSMLLSETETPVLMVPASSCFTGFDNITYTVDLTDYDPFVIKQVKSIASLFDARLNVVHVNTTEDEAVEKDQYLLSLEKTISDTLDYPKINYNFFDHNDSFNGIKKFVNQSNTQMVAMISRKQFSWSNLLKKQSLTRRVAREITVPVLAFSAAKARMN